MDSNTIVVECSEEMESTIIETMNAIGFQPDPEKRMHWSMAEWVKNIFTNGEI